MSERLLSRDEAAVILRAAQLDPRSFIERCLFIRDKGRRVIPFRLNEPQTLLHERAQRMRDAQQPIRIITAKARQEGVSTLTEAYLFTGMLTHPGTTACVLAHEKLAAQSLLGISSFFFDRLPAALRPHGRLTQNSIVLSHLQCSDGRIPINSRLFVETATGKEAGRGRTIQLLHCSEAAFFPDPERTMTGILQAVPYEPNTLVMIESTSNGVGDEFHHRWEQAENGTSGYDAIFLPWFALKEYRRPVPESFEPTKEERDEARRYGLDSEQMYWRRSKINADLDGDLMRFRQEFPATAAESFVVSGQPAYSQTDLMDYLAAAKKLRYVEGFVGPDQKFVAQRRGPLRIWKMPELGHDYLIGADTSLGVEGGSFTAASIIDRTTHEVVADMLYLVDPTTFATHVAALGKFYLTAILAIEVNYTGMTTQAELTEHIRYPRLYRWRHYDSIKHIYTDKLGWMTTPKTRPMIINDLAWAIKNHVVGLFSERAIQQLFRFDAERGGYDGDDLAMAYAIGFHCHLWTAMKDGKHPLAERRQVAPATETLDELDLLSREEWKQVAEEQKRAARGAGENQLVELSDALDGDLGEDPWPQIDW